jgi:PST family polysaccharide transporter
LPNDKETKKQILKSSSIIGGASFLTILIGLIKVKVLALLLGPAGIGIMGILTTIMSTGTALFGMGLGTSGVRELAINNENANKLNSVRKALFSANFALGLSAFFTFYLFSEHLSIWFFESAENKGAIVIIGFGVFLSLMLGSQTAVLQGLRKITELAKVKVIGALFATLAGVLIVWYFGVTGLPFFVIALPVLSFVVALFYSRQLPKLTSLSMSVKELKPQWKSLFTLGFAFMLTGLMGVGCQLLVRYILNQKLNIDAVGYFQAAWAISMTYITFVLGAMAADYYPRLTQQINNKTEANKLVNQQTEIAMILAAPVLIGMLAFATLVINLLYSSDFHESIEILRWQVFGDILKVISWPLGFILLASGRSKLFFAGELLWNVSYVSLVYLGIDSVGLEITGYAFAASYIVYLLYVCGTSGITTGFYWTKQNVKLIALLLLSGSSLLVLSYFSLLTTMVLGTFLVIVSSIFALKTVAKLGIKMKKLEKILCLFKRFKIN